MLTKDAALERLDEVLAFARKAGADAADAAYFGETSTEMSVRLGKLEDVGRSEGEELGLRVFIGNRSAGVSVSDLSREALQKAAEHAVAMAREVPEDPYAGLAPAELLAHGPFADFDLFDPAVRDLPPTRLKEMALAAEDAARAIKGITNSEGGSASAGMSIAALATTAGFAGIGFGTSVGASAVVVAGNGGDMQRDYEWHQTRHLSDLDSPEKIGADAGKRTIARLSPKPPETGKIPVVFSPRVSASLLGHLVSAISGNAIARRTSFLLDHADEPIFAPEIEITDDPHLMRGLRSRAYDGEGLPTSRRHIVENERITGWLIDTAAGRQLGLPPTGHAARSATGTAGICVSNLRLEPGQLSPEELLAGIKVGLYVDELIGMGVNGLTGDYSRGASGFMIRHGALAEPVSEATIAGNLLDMFRALIPASDLVLRQPINAPTVRIDGMMVAGN